jgi:hypothetical protein
VYDYTSDTVAYSNQFGGVDEGGMQEIVLQRRAERYVTGEHLVEGLMGDWMN